MKTYYLYCHKCSCLLASSEEVKKGLCTLHFMQAIESLREKFPKGARSSLMDDFIAPVDLKE